MGPQTCPALLFWDNPGVDLAPLLVALGREELGASCPCPPPSSFPTAFHAPLRGAEKQV